MAIFDAEYMLFKKYPHYSRRNSHLKIIFKYLKLPADLTWILTNDGMENL